MLHKSFILYDDKAFPLMLKKFGHLTERLHVGMNQASFKPEQTKVEQTKQIK